MTPPPPLATCEACREPVAPDDERTVRAVEIRHEQTHGGEPSEAVEGPVVYFHAHHVPDSPGHYRVVDR